MQAYRQKGDDEEVIKWAKETMRVIDIDNDPQNLYLQAFDELINAYETKGEVELAAQATQETLAKFPENLLLKKNLAIFMVRRKDYDSAMKIYEDVLKQVPDDLDANLTIGTILCNQDKYSEAISYLIKAHEADPENFAAVTNLMSAYYNTDQDEKGGEMRNKLKALTSGE
jgi:tetratricopeptide (TPR) repeat protein